MKSSNQALGQAPVAIAPIDSIRPDLAGLERGPNKYVSWMI
jgi:hypothetical protein